MDANTFTPTTTADDTNLHDLEALIVRTKCAGQVLAIVLDDALAAKHHGIQPQAGYTALLIDDETVDALSHAMAQLVGFSRKAAEAYTQAMRARA